MLPTALPPRIAEALARGLRAEQRAKPRRTTPDQRLEPIRALTFGRAAVVGRFDPERVLPDDLPSEPVDALRRELAAASDDASDGAHRRWILRAGPRRVALRTLQERGTLQTVLQATPADPDDRFGQLLQELLAGHTPDRAGRSTADLQTLHRAAEFAAEAGAHGAELSGIRHELGRRALDEALASVLPNGLIGRQREMAELRAFIAAPPRSAPAALVVTGIGGSGKSTLIAALVRDLRREPDAAAVALLDFDRPLITAEAVGELTIELSRQLGLAFPHLADSLARFRAEAAERAAASAADAGTAMQQNASGSQDRAELVTLAELGQCIRAGGIANRTLVLVLDTFEEVTVLGSAAVAAVRTWLGFLGSEAGFARIRTIVSGRATNDDISALDPSWSGANLRIGELEPAAAAELLVARGVDRAEADLLAGRFGGNPLLLRLLAQFRVHNADVPLTRLVGAAKGRSGGWGVAYLYDRILRHVRDAEIRRLAHPGLVLRRVTIPLIREVLAGPCRLGEIDAARAADLFERLGNQVWLVERRTSGMAGELFHRRDLRRVMLPLIGREQPARTAAIHRAAVRYYRRPIQTKGTPAANAPDRLHAGTEARYHELMLDRKRLPVITAAEATELRLALGTDIEDLPLRARAVVKALSGDRLSAAELRSIPLAERIEPVAREVDRLTDPATAVAFARDALGPTWTAKLRPAKVIQLLHATADLEGVARFVRILRDPGHLAEAVSLSRQGVDPVDSALWRVAVMNRLLGRPSPPRPTTNRPDTLDELALRECLVLLARGPRRREDPDRLGVRHDVDYDALIRLTASLPTGTIALRHAMLIGRRTDATLRLGKLPLLDPRVIARFARLFPQPSTRFSGIGRSELERQLAFLADRRNAPTLTLKVVDDALNRWVDARVVLGPTSPRQAEVLLRGTNPEFQGPVVFALWDIIVSEGAAAAVARAAWKVSPIRPVEFEPKRLATALQDGQRSWLTQLVDLIDRAGRLGQLLEAVAPNSPKGSRLALVTRAFRTWDTLLRTAWRRAR